MEMLREYLIVLGYILLVALVLGAVFMAIVWVIALVMPGEEGNRPLPPNLRAANEAARAEAWRQLDARLKGRDR
jgi:hypothetical protein